MDEGKPSLVNAVLNPVKAAVNGLMADGTIKAALRQGADEVGTALKAFPDSLQASAVGTVFHPLASEVAEERGVFGRNEAPDKSAVAQALTAPRTPAQQPESGKEVEQGRGR